MGTITDIINAHVVSQKIDLMTTDVGLSTIQKQDLWYDLKSELFSKYIARKLSCGDSTNMNEFKAHFHNVANRYCKMYLGIDTERPNLKYSISDDGIEELNY